MEVIHGDCLTTDWHGCYEGGWDDLIVPDAYAHPAKFSRALIERIVRHGLERGYWREGDVLGDPFGGIGTGGIICAYNGLRWVGVELEPRFVELAEQNFALHRPKWARLGAPEPEVQQGDSRRFAELVRCAGAVTSPPYNPPMSQDHPGRSGGSRGTTPSEPGAFVRYGDSDGQIEGLPAGTLEGAITSPPYAESIQGEHAERESAADSRAKRRTEGGSLGQSQRHGGYGAEAGNIGNLKEGALDGAVTSPPYEETKVGGNNPLVERKRVARKIASGEIDPATAGKYSRFSQDIATEYGLSNGQIGRESGETYWQAMRAVYAQMRLAVKPGGVCAVVVKDYVKQGKRIPLCDQTCELLAHLGFTVFERTRAWLVKEERHPDLFGGEAVKRKERKSFFRRLAESKGSPRIDFEEVIWAVI